MVSIVNKILLFGALGVFALLAVPATRPRLVKLAPYIAVPMLAVGLWLALAWAPREFMMGDVQRLMYVHVPSVWMALLGLTLNLACAIRYLLKPTWKTDSLAEASAAVGVLFGTVGVLLGLDLGEEDLGRLVDLGPAHHHRRDPDRHLHGLPRAPPVHRGPREARGLVGGGRDHRLRRHPPRLVLGAVAQPPPGPVEPADGRPGDDARAPLVGDRVPLPAR